MLNCWCITSQVGFKRLMSCPKMIIMRVNYGPTVITVLKNKTREELIEKPTLRCGIKK
jgi:hypothetical protein